MMKDFKVVPQMYVTKEEEIMNFCDCAFELLEKTGVIVMHPEANELLKKSGCKEENNNLFKINRKLVLECIETAPKKIEIFNRKGTSVMTLGGSNSKGINTYYGTGSDLIYNYDPCTGVLRKTLVNDIDNMATVVDYLQNIDFIMSYGLPSDCLPEKIFRVEFFSMVKNSIKPIVFTCDNGEDALRIINMAEIIAGSTQVLKERPFIICYSQPTSPLRHSFDAIGKMLVCAEKGIPIAYPPGIIPGATGPATIAGTIILSLAESFSGLVIHQLKNPGSPIILGGAHGNMDMRSGINIYASPERLKTQAVLSSIYQHFGIATWGFGGCSDSFVLDEQASIEFAMMDQWAALCGINLAHDTGYMGSGLVGDLRAILLNDEIISYVRHMLCGGVNVDENTRALDLINKVGPGGNYLGEEHTLKNFKSEFWETRFFNRISLDSWKKSDNKMFIEKLSNNVIEILENHEPIGLEKDVIKRIEKIINL